MGDEIYWKFRDGALDDLFRRMSFLVSKTVPELIRERSVFIGRYMAENTAPFAGEKGGAMDGASLAAREVGRAAVRRDIKRVYSPASETFEALKNWHDAKTGLRLAKAFYRAVKHADFETAKSILRKAGIPAARLDIMAFDAGALHQSKRDRRGRVNKGTRPTIVNINAEQLAKYSKEVAARVGYTKSGWITAAVQISTRGLSKVGSWIKSKGGPGLGEDDTRNTSHPTVRLTNLVSWTPMAMPSGLEQRAYAAFESSLRTEFESALRSLEAKAMAEGT